MDPPKAPPRSKSSLDGKTSAFVRVSSIESASPASKNEIVHIAEVHNSKSRLISSSEDSNEFKSVDRKRKKLKKKNSKDAESSSKLRMKRDMTETSEEEQVVGGTIVLNRKAIGGGVNNTGNLTETLSEDSDGENKIFLVPFPERKHRKPTGNLTETLSESESGNSSDLFKPVPPARAAASSRVSTGSSESSGIKAPVPLPRKMSATPESTRNLTESDRANFASTTNLSSKGPEIKTCPPEGRNKVASKEKAGLSENIEMSERSKIESSEEPLKESTFQIETNEKHEDDKLFSVKIHGCDPDCIIKLGQRPLVRFHIINGEEHKYAKSWTRTKGPTMPPMDTSVFELGEQQSLTVLWDEILFLDEPVSAIARQENILFFEIIDIADSKKPKTTSWAFLKLVGANGALNMDRLLRLQLYKPAKNVRVESALPQVYYWWLNDSRVKNNGSSLYVTPRGVTKQDKKSPEKVEETQKGEEEDEFKEVIEEAKEPVEISSPEPTLNGTFSAETLEE